MEKDSSALARQRETKCRVGREGRYKPWIIFYISIDIYRQEGLAMGLPLSPVLANIYLEYIEEMVLWSTSLNPSMWLTYVDDTFVLWSHQEDVQKLLDHVDSIRPSIQFTMEKEQDNKLTYLDVLVTRKKQEFSSSVFRKPTFTGQYLNFKSFHPYNVYLLTCTCIGLHPGWVEPASSRTVAHWTRYFGILLREGSQVLAGNTTCLRQIFRRGIEWATGGRRLPEQTPSGFSPEPLYSSYGPNTAGCQTNPPWVARPETEVPEGLDLAQPVATALPRWGGVGL